MRKLGHITTEVTASPDALGKSLQKHSSKVMDRETAKTLAVEVSKAFDLFNNFGKDADALKAIYRAFEEDLAGYGSEQIAAAFKAWRQENSVMPTTADILKILNPSRGRVSGPEHVVYVREPDRVPPTKQEVAEVERICAGIHKILAPEKVAPDRGGPDYRHFENHTEEAQAEIRHRFNESRKRLQRAMEETPP